MDMFEPIWEMNSDEMGKLVGKMNVDLGTLLGCGCLMRALRHDQVSRRAETKIGFRFDLRRVKSIA